MKLIRWIHGKVFGHKYYKPELLSEMIQIGLIYYYRDGGKPLDNDLRYCSVCGFIEAKHKQGG